MTTTRRIVYNYSIQVIGKIIFIVLSLIIIMLITRYLGVGEYGQYNTVIAYLGFFAVLADLGLSLIMVREVAQKLEQISEIIGNIIGLRIISSIIFLLIACVLVFIFPYAWPVKIGIIIYSIGVFLILLTQIFVGIFQLNLRMDIVAFVEVAGRAVVLAITFIFIKLGFGLYSIFVAAVIGQLVNFLLIYFFSFRYVSPTIKFDLYKWRKILKDSLSLGLIIILGMIFFKIDMVLLSVLPLDKVTLKFTADLSNNEAVGIYGVPYRILDIMIMLPALFMGLTLPIFSKYLIDNKKKARQVFKRASEFLILIGMPIAVFLFILSKFVIIFIAGIEFYQSILVLQILSIAVALSFVSYPLTIILVAAHKQKTLIMPYIFYTILNVSLNLYMIPRYSYVGAAISTVITQGVLLIINSYLVKGTLNISLGLNMIPKSIFSSTIMGLGIWFITSKNLIFNWLQFPSFYILSKFFSLGFLIIVAFILYFMTLYFVKGIKKELILEIFQKSKEDQRIS